jgi:hypothetical protein
MQRVALITGAWIETSRRENTGPCNEVSNSVVFLERRPLAGVLALRIGSCRSLASNTAADVVDDDDDDIEARHGVDDDDGDDDDDCHRRR